MRTFGKYETVQELFRGPLGSVFAARSAGANAAPTFVVKTCEPEAEILGAEQAQQEVARFTESAEVQQAVAGVAGSGGGAASGRWAPVHDLGQTPYGAYLVTDYYSRGTVEKLASGRVRFDGRAMHRLVSDVLAGLVELETVRGRPHGNLKASNVLAMEGAAGGGAGLESTRFVLSDPAPQAVMEARGAVSQDDLRALGRLVYQVVMHQGFREGTILPLAPSPEWGALGRQGDGWRELCSRLLAAGEGPAAAAEALTLESVQQQVAALAAARGGGRGKLGLVAAAAVLLVGGAVAAIVWPSGQPASGPVLPVDPSDPSVVFDPEKWSRLLAEYRSWFGRFEQDMADASRQDRLARDADLAPIVARFRELQRRKIPLNPKEIAREERSLQQLAREEEPPDGARTAEAIAQTAAAVELMDLIEQTLTAEKWGALRQVSQAATALEARGWGSQATAAGEVGRYAPRVQLAAGIDEVAAAATVLHALEQRWGRIDAALKSFDQTGDALLGRFPEWIRVRVAESAGTARGVDLLRNAEAALGEVEELAEELRGFIAGEWSSLEEERVAEFSRGLAAAATVSAGMFRDWKFRVSEFRSLDPQLDPRRTWTSVEIVDSSGQRKPLQGPAALADVLSRRAALQSETGAELDEPTAARIAAVLAELEQAQQSVLRWNAANQGRVDDLSRRAHQELDELSGHLGRRVEEVRLSKAQEWDQVVAQFRGRGEVVPGAGAEAPLNAAWRRWRDGVLAEVQAAGSRDRLALISRMREIEDILKSVDAGVGRGAEAVEPGLAWSAALSQAAAAERERLIAGVVAGFGQQVPAAAEVEAAVERAAAEHGIFAGRLRELSQRAWELEGLLNLAHGLEEGVTAATAQLREQLQQLSGAGGGLGQALDPVLSRVSRLEQIARSSDREELVRQVREARANQPEQAVAAWRRLGQLPAQPWPASLDELSRERQLREAVERVANNLLASAAERHGRLVEELNRQGPLRWERGAAALRDAEELESALAMLADHGLRTRGEIQDGRLRFNAMMHALLGGMAQSAGDEEAVLSAVDGFLAETADLPADVRQQAEGIITGLTEASAAYRAQASGSQPRVDVTRLGPGALEGWQGQEDDGGQSVVFRRAGADGLELRFVLVEGDPAGGREAVYLQDRELSLGAFIALVEQAGAWQATANLLKSTDRRDGPQVWQESSGRLTRARWWTPTHADIRADRPAYAADLLDPRDVNQVSAEQGPPSNDMPMQQLPASAALYVARLAGCRLPTSAEWLAAYESDGRQVGLSQWNLRDETWRRQLEHVKAVRAVVQAKHVFLWPDTGAFMPADRRGRGAGSILAGESATARPTDDGRLWFAPVENGPGRLKHLVGNVAEYVFDDPAAAEALDTAAARPFEDLLARSAAALRVVGGSAMSAPEIPLETAAPVSLDDAEYGFSDVGMRLAFPASGVSAQERLGRAAQRVLGRQPYLLQ